MSVKSSPYLFGILLFCSFTIFEKVIAQDIIVESPKISDELIDASRRVNILTEHDLSKQSVQTVSDALRTIPGIEVVRQGTFAQTTSVFVRGANSEDTLVLIDGVIVNDSMSPASGFDFSQLSTINISRIEVFRGPQSVTYGAGALGGVINIITKKGKGPTKLNYILEAGSYATQNIGLRASGSKNRTSYSFGVNHLRTNGFSSALKTSGPSENDAAQISTLSTKVEYKLSALSHISFVSRYSNSKMDIDTSGGDQGDDPNNIAKTNHLVTGVTTNHSLLSSRLNSKFGVYRSQTQRNNRNLPDTNSSTDLQQKYESENYRFIWENEYLLGQSYTIRSALSFRKENGNFSSDSNSTKTTFSNKSQSLYAGNTTLLYDSRSWFYDIGFRADINSIVDPVYNFRASFGRKYLETKSKISLTFGTGHKLPSLFQLYSAYGDLTLKEENSKAIDFSFEQEISNNIFATLGLFKNEYENLIDFNSATNKYFNISHASTEGLELQLTTRLSDSIRSKLSYTYLETKDNQERPLIRRSPHSWALEIETKFNQMGGFIKYRYKNNRIDINPTTFQRQDNPSYYLVDIGTNYNLTNRLKVFSRVENLFNRNYEEVKGYQTAAVSFFLGLSGEI